MSLTRRTLLSAAAAAPALIRWETSAAESDLDDAVRAYDQATVHNDVAALARLVSDDYVLVNSDSTLQDKQSYLEDFKVPGFKLDPYVLDQSLRRVWGDTALVAGVVNLSWTHFRELFLEEQLRLRHASNAPRARKRALAWDVTRGGAERTRPRTDTIG